MTISYHHNGSKSLQNKLATWQGRLKCKGGGICLAHEAVRPSFADLFYLLNWLETNTLFSNSSTKSQALQKKKQSFFNNSAGNNGKSLTQSVLFLFSYDFSSQLFLTKQPLHTINYLVVP